MVGKAKSVLRNLQNVLKIKVRFKFMIGIALKGDSGAADPMVVKKVRKNVHKVVFKNVT